MMKVIRPIQITSDKILQSSAVEFDPNWLSTTTYSLGNRVVYENSVYESLQNSNLNRIPSTSPTFWIRVTSSNKFAMFDSAVNTQTKGNPNLSVTVKPGDIVSSVSLLNIAGNNLTLVVKDQENGSVVYQTQIMLEISEVFNWYDYFFEPFESLTEITVNDLPPYKNGVIEILLESDSQAAIGVFVTGQVSELGGVEYGVNGGIRDYSVKETDQFGNTTLVQRDFSKRLDPRIFVENSKLNRITKILAELRSTPTVWIGSENPELQPLILFGYIKDWNFEIPYPAHTLISLQIEGLI